jgi:hypothetical protein
VRFVVTRDQIVDAEVIHTHVDGRLDLRGKFGQSNHKWTDTEIQDSVTGEKQIFAEDKAIPDPRVSEMYRVREADQGDTEAGRHVPGTFFKFDGGE